MFGKVIPYVSLALVLWLMFDPDARDSIPEIRFVPRNTAMKRNEEQFSSPDRKLEKRLVFLEQVTRVNEELRARQKAKRLEQPIQSYESRLPEHARPAPVPGPGEYENLIPVPPLPVPVRPPVQELNLVPTAVKPQPVTNHAPNRDVPLRRVPMLRNLPPRRSAPPPPRRPEAPAPTVDSGAALFHRMKEARLFRQPVASDQAMAALRVGTRPDPYVGVRTNEDTGDDADDDPYVPLPSAGKNGTLVPFYAASPYPELPAKGLEVWAEGTKICEEQKSYEEWHNPYQMDGSVYSLGVKKDWSVDSIIGASVDIIRNTVESKETGDLRKNDIDGYVINAHYDGALFGKLPFSLKGFYGKLDSEGGGDLYAASGMSFRTWREDSHSMDLYGLSARVGVPLIFGNDIRIFPEIGIEYKALTSQSYSFFFEDDPSAVMHVPEMTSRSLSVPISVTFSRDFLQTWGLVTPKIGVGLVHDFEDSAIGVRALNSSSIVYQEAATTGFVRDIAFAGSRKTALHFNGGVSVKTVGGWQLDAEYQRQWSSNWYNNTFRLQVGRYF